MPPPLSFPASASPPVYRSTSHGISAASGKVGAIIAQVVFGPLRTRGAKAGATGAAASPWLNHVMEIFALFMLCGIFTTLLIPETKRKTLEELAGEVPGTPNYDERAAGHTGRKESYAAAEASDGSGNNGDMVQESTEKSNV